MWISAPRTEHGRSCAHSKREYSGSRKFEPPHELCERQSNAGLSHGLADGLAYADRR